MPVFLPPEPWTQPEASKDIWLDHDARGTKDVWLYPDGDHDASLVYEAGGTVIEGASISATPTVDWPGEGIAVRTTFAGRESRYTVRCSTGRRLAHLTSTGPSRIVPRVKNVSTFKMTASGQSTVDLR